MLNHKKREIALLYNLDEKIIHLENHANISKNHIKNAALFYAENLETNKASEIGK